MPDFAHTSPLVHDSGRMPWPNEPTDVEREELARTKRITAWFRSLPGCQGYCAQGRLQCEFPEVCLAVADEIVAAQAEGARMAMGDQAPSAPMPLEEPGLEVREINGAAIGLLLVIASGLGFWALFAFLAQWVAGK